MVAKNEITGDKIQSKPSTKEYEENFDRIFGKKKTINDVTPEELDEVRINVIGQNGNTVEHYIQDNLPQRRVNVSS